MKNKYLITNYKGKIICVVYEDGLPVEIIFEDESAYPVGSIYIGHVDSIVKNLKAAFVDLGDKNIGYLPLKDEKEVKAGSDILVQIEKEAIKSKEIRLTDEISIAGRYFAISKGRPGIAISKKISSEEIREKLKNLVRYFIDENSFLKEFFSDNHGVVIRTAAVAASEEEIKKELLYLVSKFKDTVGYADNRSTHSCIYAPIAEYLSRIRDASGEPERIVTDIKDVYDEITDYFKDREDILEKTAYYQDEMLPLIKLYGIETVIEEALGRRVWLKSGGFLIIEPTEALTVIDVNSGKNINGKSKKKLIFDTNMEAARESARQLRLRNISGIVIIDFINMRDTESKERIITELKLMLKNDRVHAQFVDMTPLGLAEITREKIRKPLSENLSKQ